VRTKSPGQAEKILTVAARLFATHRFHEARMDDIAAAAEVGKGTLYRYFKDKEQLYLTLLDRAGQGLTERVEQALAGAADAPEARLTALVAALLGYFDDQPFLFDLITHAEAMQRPGGELPWQKVRQENLDRVLALFEEGRRRGDFAVREPYLAALMLLGGLRSVLRFGRALSHADLARRIIADFLRGSGRAAETP
jgi:AcrR family transcriptional regulator